MAKVASLFTSLELESSQFVVGLKRSVDQAAKSGRAIEQHLNRARSAATALAGFWAGSEIVGAGKRALEYASSLGEVAQQLGITTKDLQEYRYAASQAGVSQEEMDKGLAKLTRTIGEAKAGSKAQVAVFRELGLSIEDANGRVYTAGEMIPKIADALEKIKDPASRARIEVDLFGKAGQKLDTLLSGGSKAINNLRDAAQRLGLVLSDEQIQKADETADRLADVKQVLEANIAGVVADNAQAILTLANALAQAAAQSAKFAVEYPKAAGLLAGAAIGSRFGPWGAAAGGLAGVAVGAQMQRAADGQNMDLNFRMEQMRQAQRQVRLQQRTTGQADLSKSKSQGAQFALDNLRKETALLRAATAAANGKPAVAQVGAVVGDGALPTATASPSRKRTGGASGPSAEDIQERYRQQLRSIVGQTLSANASMATSAEARAEIAHRQLNDDLRGQREEIDADRHFSQAQKDRLKEELDHQEEVERARIDAEMNGQLIDEEVAARRESVQRELQSLGIRDAMATTDAERRRLQLQMLDKEIELDRLGAQAIIDKESSSKAEKALAQAKLDSLAGEKAQRTLAINQRTMGPLESYMTSIPKTADEINAAYENIAVNGIAHMNDALAESATRVLKLKGFAGQLFNQLISDLIRFQLQQATGGAGGLLGGLIKLGGSILGLGGNPLSGVSASSLSFMDGQAAALATPRNLPGFDAGGSFRIRGNPGIDQNVMSINGQSVARVGHGEIVDIQRAGSNDNGASRVHVVPSPFFNVIVERVAYGVAAPMAAEAASAGSNGAQIALSRAGGRRIP